MKGYGVFSFASSMILLALLVFAVLQGMQIPVGNFIDWVIGMAIFAWLMTIVTVPWNIHFEALEVINDAKTSKKRNIQFDESQLGYVKKLYRWSLVIAIALHLISAACLYYLSWANISQVGYYGAGAALLLTLLRPSIRAYEYISRRLASIRQDIKYPTDDVQTLKMDLEEWKNKLKAVRYKLNEEKAESWISQLNQTIQQHTQKLEILQNELENLKTENRKEHEKISKETHQAVAQLTEDGKFIDNLVEIIRFIKKV